MRPPVVVVRFLVEDWVETWVSLLWGDVAGQGADV
jgi:hypothetical protein